jgi:sigma54-dependent transcription regulator
MATRKISARTKYERDSKKNLKLYRSGKIDGRELFNRSIDSINNVAPHMTEDELLKVQSGLFEMMNNVTGVLAK